jgi:uncharacterized protein YoaH (UPF0181 family)
MLFSGLLSLSHEAVGVGEAPKALMDTKQKGLTSGDTVAGVAPRLLNDFGNTARISRHRLMFTSSHRTVRGCHVLSDHGLYLAPLNPISLKRRIAGM